MEATAISVGDQQLSPERWEKAEYILTGQDPGRISLTAAAEAAGVSVRVLKQWFQRSQERRPEDEPWVWEIAEVMGSVANTRTCRGEDLLWQRIQAGEPGSNPLLLRFLSAHSKKYSERKHVSLEDQRIEPSEMLKRMKAVQQLDKIGAKSVVIEGEVVNE